MDDKQIKKQNNPESDTEDYGKLGGIGVALQQCDQCVFRDDKNLKRCKKYEKEDKPDYIFIPKKECGFFVSEDELDLNISNDLENKAKGAIYGAVVGDALGVPVEFSYRKERKKDPVREMRAYGSYYQHFGTWSDDSSLLLCLVETINQGYDLKKLAGKFRRYADQGYMTPYDKLFDIGNGTEKAIKNIMAGVDPVECGGNSLYENGNGSLMRILPVAFYVRKMSPELQVKITEDVSSVTHAHSVARLACIIYIQIALNLINGLDKEEAYKAAIKFVKENLKKKYSSYFKIFRRILNGKIASRKENRIKSSGYVLDSLEAALWCFLNEKSYEECVFRAVNLGRDTDTIACIAGGLAGLYYGVSSIRNNWIQMLPKKHQIDRMINDYIEIVK